MVWSDFDGFCFTLDSGPSWVALSSSLSIPENPMDTRTRLVHAARHTPGAAHAANPPLVRASTLLFDNVAAYRASYHGTVFETPRYGRSGTVTNFELQSAFADLSGAESCVATGSSLSAVAAVLGAHAGTGRHVLIHAGVYGPTRTLCEQELPAWGTRVQFFDDAASLQAAITPDTSLIYIEVPTSLTMRMLDAKAICAIARTHRIPVACDASWGTPVFFDAHGLGIDIAVHAGTKFINGHSDVMLGLLTGTRAALEPVRRWCDRFGTHASADSCWLAMRGLRTLALRLQAHQAGAQVVAGWLQQHPAVKRVLYPALASDPDHALWRQQFSGAAGPFAIELQPCTQGAFDRFIDALQLFGLGTSWGGYESLVLPAVPYALRTLPALPDEGRLVRLHVGLEDPHDLCADLAQALVHLQPPQ
jgi:cystathionine beta-lyase